MLYEGPIEPNAGFELVGPYRVAEATVDRAEVHKARSGQPATIRIRLKPGVVPERVR